MSLKFNKHQIERFSRQIILKDVGTLGQNKIIKSRVLIIGMGGLGCPVAEFLTRAGVKKTKVIAARKKLKKINSKIKVSCHKIRLNKNNYKKILKNYDYVVDGSDNFKTKFLINKYSIYYKKILIVGAISKFEGHIFSFDFKKKTNPCLKCFYQNEPSDDILNCEADGVLGPVAGVIGSIQSNEVLKVILNIGKKLYGQILVFNLKNLEFRTIKYNKKKNCTCTK